MQTDIASERPVMEFRSVKCIRNGGIVIYRVQQKWEIQIPHTSGNNFTTHGLGYEWRYLPEVTEAELIADAYAKLHPVATD